VPGQALQLLPLFAAAHAITIVLRLIGGGAAGLDAAAGAVLEAALWWPVSVLLLAPQRRAPDPDENRPCEPGRWPAYNKRDAKQR
jgi:rod shape-determining protein MreD